MEEMLNAAREVWFVGVKTENRRVLLDELNGYASTAAWKGENEVQGGFILDVVVEKRVAVLEQFSCEEQALASRWDTFSVVNHIFDLLDGRGKLCRYHDCPAGECSDEYLQRTPNGNYKLAVNNLI
jgi:hypothetical protein